MKAVVLAGGKGMRMRPLTNEIPKPLLLVKNRPILEHTLNYLSKYGIKEVIITLGYKGEVIKKKIGDGSRFGLNITYSMEKDEMGTAGCLLSIKKDLNETFVLIGGDNITKMDLNKFIKFHKKNGGTLTVALYTKTEKTKFGIYELGKDKSIKIFREKPIIKKTIGTMIFCMEPEIFNYIPGNKKPVNITDHVIPKMLSKNKKIFGFEFDDMWMDIGTFDDYNKINRMKI
jgi:mannose-1-phosphate guanylyltransferase/phosphomannomutase